MPRTPNNKRIASRIAAVIGIVAVILCMSPFGVLNVTAADNTMYTNEYNVRVEVAENNSYDYQEDLSVYYMTPHHGIYRYVPVQGQVISNIRVPGYAYETYDQNGYKVIKIGDVTIDYDALTVTKGTESQTLPPTRQIIWIIHERVNCNISAINALICRNNILLNLLIHPSPLKLSQHPLLP